MDEIARRNVLEIVLEEKTEEIQDLKQTIAMQKKLIENSSKEYDAAQESNKKLMETIANYKTEIQTLQVNLNTSKSRVRRDAIDNQTLDEEIYTNTILSYLTEIVFQEVVLESGESFDKAESVDVLQKREDDLRETVKAAIDNHLSQHIHSDISSLTFDEIRNIQIAALKDVFAEWEAFEQ